MTTVFTIVGLTWLVLATVTAIAVGITIRAADRGPQPQQEPYKLHLVA